MKKLLTILTIFLLCGCVPKNTKVKEESFGRGDFYIYCDKKYGVEYIQWVYGYVGGITIRMDENGDVIRCEVSK